jgi:hypothetical protein
VIFLVLWAERHETKKLEKKIIQILEERERVGELEGNPK